MCYFMLQAKQGPKTQRAYLVFRKACLGVRPGLWKARPPAKQLALAEVCFLSDVQWPFASTVCHLLRHLIVVSSICLHPLLQAVDMARWLASHATWCSWRLHGSMRAVLWVKVFEAFLCVFCYHRSWSILYCGSPSPPEPTSPFLNFALLGIVILWYSLVISQCII